MEVKMDMLTSEIPARDFVEVRVGSLYSKPLCSRFVLLHTVLTLKLHDDDTSELHDDDTSETA